MACLLADCRDVCRGRDVLTPSSALWSLAVFWEANTVSHSPVGVACIAFLPVSMRFVSHASSDRLRRLGLRPRAIFNGARPRGSAGSRVHATARRIRIRRRVAVLRDPARPRGFRSAGGGETSRVRTSGGVRRPSRALGLAPAPRAGSPGACAAFRAAMLRRPDTASSPRSVPRRASAEPRRRVSLSSALGPSPGFLSSGCRSDASQPPLSPVPKSGASMAAGARTRRRSVR